jgi:hypothetical protein
MPAYQPIALELSLEPAGPLEAVALQGASKHAATIDPWAAEPHGFSPREPSTLALMLVGVATLAAYRGVVRTLGRGKTARPANPPLIKPRRRAA